jgi:hypothetical protein
MSELRTVLEEIEEQISARPDSLERVFLRHRRRQRNKRITAGVTALAIAALGAFGIAHGFLFTERRPVTNQQTPVQKPVPESLQPIHRFPMKFPQDIVVAFGSVWTTNEFLDAVTRIDPTTGRTITIDVGAGVGPSSIEEAGGAIWVGGNEAIVRIDPTTNSVGPRVRGSFMGGARNLASGFGSIWADVRSGVLRIDPATGARIAEIAVTGQKACIQGVTTAADSVWVGCGTTAVRIDPTTNAVVGTVPDVGPWPLILSAGETLWVMTGTDIFSAPKPGRASSRLARIDPATNTVIPGTTIRLVRGASAPIPHPEGDVIWFPISTGRGPGVGMLYEFDGLSGRVVRAFDLSEGRKIGSNAVAFGYGSLWTASGTASQVRRFIDPGLSPETPTQP